MTADEVLALVDGLRARGVPPGQPHTQTTMVDAGGGLMVDSDLFSHEAGE